MLMKTKLMLAGLAIAIVAGPASANETFNVSGAAFDSPFTGSPDGTLAGSFTTNDAFTSILGYNLTASASGAFAGFNFTNANSSVTASSLPSQYFQIDSANNINELRLYFISPLTTSGAVLNPFGSYENEPSGGNRFIAGAISPAPVIATGAVPEPASWLMMILGMGAVGYTMRSAKRRSDAKFDAKIKRITFGVA